MKYSNKFRQEIFEKYTDLGNRVHFLRGIVQNEMDITDVDLVEQQRVLTDIVVELVEIQGRLPQGE